MSRRPTLERLREALLYNRETGVFTWKKTRCYRLKPGDTAGSVKGGYIQISLDERKYRAHNLAWLYVTGAWPSGEIDHKDRDGMNNRFDNLRDVTRAVQMKNRGKFKNNTSGARGVFRTKRGGKFVPHVSVDGKVKRLGYFSTLEEAQRVRENYIAQLAEYKI